MLGQYIKNLFSKKPKHIPSYSQFNIRHNSRITFDSTEFDAYDNLLIVPNPGNTLVVNSINKSCDYGVEVFDFYCTSTTNNLTYLLRVQEMSNGELLGVTLFHLVNKLYMQHGRDWTELFTKLKSNENYIASFNEGSLQLEYSTEMYETYSCTPQNMDPQGPAAPSSVQGKEYYRIYRDVVDNQPVKEYLLVEIVDKSYVNEYAGIELNPAGISVI